jgi:hypothetical protein
MRLSLRSSSPKEFVLGAKARVYFFCLPLAKARGNKLSSLSFLLTKYVNPIIVSGRGIDASEENFDVIGTAFYGVSSHDGTAFETSASPKRVTLRGWMRRWRVLPKLVYDWAKAAVLFSAKGKPMEMT